MTHTKHVELEKMGYERAGWQNTSVTVSIQ